LHVDKKWIMYDNPKYTWIDPGQLSTSKLNIHTKEIFLCIW